MEGTTWESLHIIENFKIKNLLLIIDRNNSDFRSIKFIKLKKNYHLIVTIFLKLTDINYKLLIKL